MQDIGQLGPKEGSAVIYNWKWYYSASGLALWVVLILVLVLIKANRNRHALLILVPLLIVNLLWLIFRKAMGFGSANIEMFNMMFNSLVVGITVLWLVGHKLGNRNRFVTFLLALIVVIVVGYVGLISYSVDSDETTMFLSLLAILALAVLISFVLSSWRCREHYNGLRFILWLGFWTVIISIIAILTFMVVMFGFEGRLPRNVTDMLLQVLVVGLVIGLLSYVINLSFMILALSSPFYRERFYACLRLKSMPKTIGMADTDQLGEQSSGPETS